MMATRPFASSSESSTRENCAGRPGLPSPRISPLSVDSSSTALASSSSVARGAQTSELEQSSYLDASPVDFLSQRKAPTMASPFERSPPVQSSTSPPPNPPAVAHLSQSSAATQPQGYTPLNDLSASARAALKGKGRAHNQGWVDLERGAEAGSLVDDEERDMVKDGWERVDGAGGAQVSDTVTEYPPPVAMSEEEREEKRIADVGHFSFGLSRANSLLPCRFVAND